MGKVKQTNGKAAKVADPLTTVKSAGVSKASSTPVAKSKKLAKDIAIKAVNGKDSKKGKKKVESDSESEDSSASEKEESDSDSESDASADKSDESSDSDSSEDDSDDSGSDDSEDSESEEEKKPAPKAKVNGKVAAPATNGKAKKADDDSSDSSDSSDAEEEDDDDSDDSEGDADATKKADAEAESSDSEDDSDDSDDSEASETEKKPEPSKKRKAVEEEAPPFKKVKADESEEAAPTNLFVGNLGWGIDDDALYAAFKDCADLVAARVMTDKATGRSRGFGYVDFSSAESCNAALEAMQGFELEGRAMNLDLSKPRPAENANPRDRANDRAQKHGDTVSPESDTLFVGNLPFDADEEMVTEFFNEVAEVKSLRLPTDPESGNRKGFGYVTFNSVEDAKNVFDTKFGAYLGEGRGARAIRLDYASQRPPREGGGGFGGGRGGGGRGGGRGFGGGRGGGSFGGRGGGGGFGGRGGGGGFRGGDRGRGGRGGGFGGRGGGGFQGKKISFD